MFKKTKLSVGVSVALYSYLVPQLAIAQTNEPEDIEQIEVVRGAQTALYGTDTIGGVINFITSKPNQPGFSYQLVFVLSLNRNRLQDVLLQTENQRHHICHPSPGPFHA